MLGLGFRLGVGTALDTENVKGSTYVLIVLWSVPEGEGNIVKGSKAVQRLLLIEA